MPKLKKSNGTFWVIFKQCEMAAAAKLHILSRAFLREKCRRQQGWKEANFQEDLWRLIATILAAAASEKFDFRLRVILDHLFSRFKSCRNSKVSVKPKAKRDLPKKVEKDHHSEPQVQWSDIMTFGAVHSGARTWWQTFFSLLLCHLHL